MTQLSFSLGTFKIRLQSHRSIINIPLALLTNIILWLKWLIAALFSSLYRLNYSCKMFILLASSRVFSYLKAFLISFSVFKGFFSVAAASFRQLVISPTCHFVNFFKILNWTLIGIQPSSYPTPKCYDIQYDDIRQNDPRYNNTISVLMLAVAILLFKRRVSFCQVSLCWVLLC